MKKPKTIPVWLIVCGSLFFAYLILFVGPTFLNPAHSMAFPKYIPTLDPIGADLREFLTFSTAWIENGSPYTGRNLYPPLASALYAPLTALPFTAAFTLILSASIAAYVSVILILPLISCPRADHAAAVALAFASLLSYGFQFELERGQFNVLAMACCAWAIWLFHARQNRWSRLAAYVLFSAAIQLKLYPAVFVFTLTRNARDWKGNLLRWGALGAANLALLFALGPSVFRDFMAAISTHAAHPYVWEGNHSMASCAAFLMQNGLGSCSFPLLPAFGLILLVCFASVLWLAYVRNERSAFKHVVAICGFAALLIPSTSHDYKLPILGMTLAVWIAETPPIAIRRSGDFLLAMLCFSLCALHAWTLFSFVVKPRLLQNNALAMLLSCVLLVWIMAIEEVQRRKLLPSQAPTAP